MFSVSSIERLSCASSQQPFGLQSFLSCTFISLQSFWVWLDLAAPLHQIWDFHALTPFLSRVVCC